jgi:hypothetical protein
MYGFIFISYVELCAMSTFQKSTYLDSLEFIKKFLSTDLDASLPPIGWHRRGHGTLIDNFGELFGLAFHNLMRIPSIGLHIGYVGETLYYTIGQPKESTKI